MRGIVQSQPRQDTTGVQGVATGPGRHWGYWQSILVGPALTHDGFYGPYHSRVKRRWRSLEDYLIWDLEYSFFDIQALHGHDALYVPKPRGDHGFSDNKAPSSYQVSHRVCLWHWGVGQEVSYIRLSRRLHGGMGNKRTFSQGRTH